MQASGIPEGSGQKCGGFHLSRDQMECGRNDSPGTCLQSSPSSCKLHGSSEYPFYSGTGIGAGKPGTKISGSKINSTASLNLNRI